MIGMTLDERYVVKSMLGAGGMGVVYRAHDTGLDRDVAIKVMGDHLLGSESSAERFLREAKLAARLNHHNIGGVHDVGRDSSGRLYLVMPLLEGSPLSKLVNDEGPLRIVDALTAIADAAAGLTQAHRAGIVHRDVKPGNLFLTEQGRLVVLDFGIARLIDATGDATALLGTAEYMAPEQIDPDTFGRVGAAADIYGLTGVLLHAVTGRSPFPDAESNAQLLYAHTNRPRPVPSDRGPQFAWLDAVVARGMAIDQTVRPPTAEALIADAVACWRAAVGDNEASELDNRSDALRALRRYDHAMIGHWIKIVNDLESNTRGRTFMIELKPDGIVIEHDLFEPIGGHSWTGTWRSGRDNEGRATVEVVISNKYIGNLHQLNSDLYVGFETGPKWEGGVETQTIGVNARLALVRVNTDGTAPGAVLDG